IHINDVVRIDIMGERKPLVGHVASIAAGIEDRERSDSVGSFASVAPTFSWIRRAQRIPVRIEIDDIPDAVRLIAGRTATVTIEPTRE
ncbi:efflux transporter periplasmic adaptor subunit, partial [Brucella intermedia]